MDLQSILFGAAGLALGMVIGFALGRLGRRRMLRTATAPMISDVVGTPDGTGMLTIGFKVTTGDTKAVGFLTHVFADPNAVPDEPPETAEEHLDEVPIGQTNVPKSFLHMGGDGGTGTHLAAVWAIYQEHSEPGSGPFTVP